MTIEDSQASSRYYQHEAEATRNRLARGLDELNDRLTPGQVFDEVLTYAKGGGGTFFRALTNAARENPVPSLLIGTGCMLFLAEKMGFSGIGRGSSGSARGRGNGEQPYEAAAGSRAYTGAAGYSEGRGYRGSSDYRSGEPQGRSTVQAVGESASNLAAGTRDRVSAVGERISGAAQSAASTLTDTARSATDTLSNAAQGAAETARDTWQGVGARVSDTTDRLKQSAQGLGETVQQYSSAVTSQVSDTASQLAERADRGRRQMMDVAGQMKDRAATLAEEQPLLVAGIAFAAGAALAAALPMTETENELMGETSDRLKGTVKGVASERLEAVKSAAGQVAQDAQAALQKGMDGDPAEAAREFGSKVKDAVSNVAGTSTESAASSGSGTRSQFSTQSSSEAGSSNETGTSRDTWRSSGTSSSSEPRPSDLTGMDKLS